MVALSTFTFLHDHHHQPSPELLRLLELELYPHSTLTVHVPPPRSPWQTLFYFSLNVTLLGFS